MPSWTLGNLMSSATRVLGNRADITLSVCSFWTNEAERIVWDALPFDAKEGLAVSSTTSGENRIALPTDFQAMLNVSNLSVAGYDLMEQQNIDFIDSSATGNGAPKYWVRFQDWIELWPSPDSAYSIQIRYEKQRSDMTVTGARPSVSTRYHLAVFYKTTALLANEVLAPEMASYYDGQYLSTMASTPSDLAMRQRSREGMNMRFQRKAR